MGGFPFRGKHCLPAFLCHPAHIFLSRFGQNMAIPLLPIYSVLFLRSRSKRRPIWTFVGFVWLLFWCACCYMRFPLPSPSSKVCVVDNVWVAGLAFVSAQGGKKKQKTNLMWGFFSYPASCCCFVLFYTPGSLGHFSFEAGDAENWLAYLCRCTNTFYSSCLGFRKTVREKPVKMSL